MPSETLSATGLAVRDVTLQTYAFASFCTRIESKKHGIFAITRINRPMQDNLRQSWILDSARWIPNFMYMYWFPDFSSVELGFGIPDSLSWIPDSTIARKFEKQDYLKWGKRAHLFVASGIVWMKYIRRFSNRVADGHKSWPSRIIWKLRLTIILDRETEEQWGSKVYQESLVHRLDRIQIST